MNKKSDMMSLNKRADMMSFLLHVISMVFVIIIVVVVIAMMLPAHPGTYTVFNDIVDSAETACNPNSPAHVSTPLTIEPGYFIAQIYYNPNENPGCLEVPNIGEDKFWEFCSYRCDPGTFCLCVGKTTAENHGVVFEDWLPEDPLSVDFDELAYYTDVIADRGVKCMNLDSATLPIEDNSLCCATINCITSLNKPVYLSNIQGFMFDGMYADPPGILWDGGTALKIEGQFRLTRITPDDKNMFITYR
jgi:hypothetical protein